MLVSAHQPNQTHRDPKLVSTYYRYCWVSVYSLTRASYRGLLEAVRGRQSGAISGNTQIGEKRYRGSERLREALAGQIAFGAAPVLTGLRSGRPQTAQFAQRQALA